MEALRTQLDNLQWEVNRLDVENRRLREQDPDGSRRVDLEAQLDRAKEDVAALTEQVTIYERQLTESTSAAASAEQRATETEDLARERMRETEQTYQERLEEADGRVSRLRLELDTSRRDLTHAQEELAERERELEGLQERWEREREALLRTAELDRYKALEGEREKWEARESRVVEQLEGVKRQLGAAKECGGGGVEVVGEMTSQLQRASEELQGNRSVISELRGEREVLHLELREVRAELALAQAKLQRVERGGSTPDSGDGVGGTMPPSPQTTPDPLPVGGEPPSTAVAQGAGAAAALTFPQQRTLGPASSPSPIVAQLPQIPCFNGENQSDGEAFQDWHEQFESVSVLGRWDDHCKLVNLTTRLRGAAYSFYRSCNPTQRSNYSLLVDALKKRFTPVQLAAVQTQLFHDRKQGARESVDEFAQELRRLFTRAYAGQTRGTPEAEKMGQTVLANQFIAGLLPELKSKIVGLEGSFDELLMKARFEEAKGKELMTVKTTSPPKKPAPSPSGPPPATASRTYPKVGLGPAKPDRGKKCFNCGLEGHMKRDCPYPKQPKGESEARGNRDGRVANVTGGGEGSGWARKQRIQDLRRELQEAELEEAVEHATAVLHQVAPVHEGARAKLGPVVHAPVQVNGVATDALVDTGSPATIVSLDFVLRVLASAKTNQQTPSQWKEATLRKFSRPEVTLKTYGGHPLDIMSQILLCLTQGTRSVEAVVLVQKDAPNELLLGTDVQSQLGFSLLMENSDEEKTDLLSERGDNSREKNQPQELLEEDPASGGVAPGVVHLLQGVRVPAGYQRMVRAAVGGGVGEDLLLFTPELDQTCLAMADSVVEVGDGNCVTLVVQNRGVETLHLEKGMRLGKVIPVELVTHAEDVEVGEERMALRNEGRVLHLVPGSDSEGDRVTQLLEQLDLQIEHLTPEQQRHLVSELTSYADVFALSPSELGTTDVVAHSINTAEHAPIRQPIRRMPFALRARTAEMVEEMLAMDVIEPSSSPWSSPVVLVRKKDGGVRFCVDYRRLNRVTKLDEFPLPRIDDTLDLLAGAQFFTTLDLASGYWQVAMDPLSREKTAFCTYAGHYQFKKMPFGLVNAPATFQRLMEVVLAGLARKGCMVYLDDVVVIGKTFEEHSENLRKVLERLREAGLRLKPKKCKFAQQEVEYLGHVVSTAGVRTDPKKVEAVAQFPPPADVKTLRSFLGLASYYRRFVPGFAKVAKPLHALTGKDVPFAWGPECQLAFEKLKELLTSSPVLAYPDFGRGFILETDASGAGLGAVLAQEQEDGSVRPIAYASRSLQPHERNYGVTELEGLGVVWAVRHFRPYLYGHSCKVFTDHEALKSLLNTPQPSGKLARWGMAIQELTLEILHRSGRHNANADALSRAPLQSQDAGDGLPQGVVATATADQDSLANKQRQDPQLLDVITFLETGVLPTDEKSARMLALTQSQYQIQDDVLYHVEPDCTLRVVPPSSLREQLFQQAHQGLFGAHLSDAKVHSELQRHYWWSGMRTDITRWTRSCLVCATHSPGRAVRPPLTPIPVAGPFDRVGVDVIQLPQSYSGNQYAVVFVDYLTKWPEVFAVADQSAATIAKLLVENVVSRHGVPSEILSDRGRAFLSGLMKEVEALLGYHKVNTSAYHPQTDGLVERFNRTLVGMLAKTAERNGKDWDQHLPFVLFAYRASKQESTQESPFFLLYGRDPRLPVEAILSPPEARKLTSLKQYGSELAERMSLAWELARKSIAKAQCKQKAYYDQGSRPLDFEVGDWVFLFKPAERTGESRKLARPYHGPYRVVKLGNNTAHVRRVDRPQSEPILVAVNRLRRCPPGVPDQFWPPDKAATKRSKQHPPIVEKRQGTEASVAPSVTPMPANRAPRTSERNRWSGRLRSHKAQSSSEDG